MIHAGIIINPLKGAPVADDSGQVSLPAYTT